MKILYLITRAERGGAQVHVADLLRGFRSCHELSLAVGEDGYLRDEAQKLAIPAYKIRGLRQPMDPMKDGVAVASLIMLLRRIKPDMIHAHTSKAGLVARIAAFTQRIPVIYTAHTWSFTEGASPLRRAMCVPVEKLCAALSAHIITVSEANRAAALQLGVGLETRLTTIWNGVPDTPLRSRPQVGDPVTVVMVARFVGQKDHLLLIRALATVKTPFRLILVGSGPTLPAVKTLVKALRLDEAVSFPGDQGDIAGILRGAQIFVLSTNWEGLPLSILEAMRAGLPVIATDVGGVREAVHDKLNGFLVERGNVHELALALISLISDPELRARMGRFGRELYETNFLPETMLLKTEAVYRDAIKRAWKKNHETRQERANRARSPRKQPD